MSSPTLVPTALVPAYLCPKGTKMHILNLGNLTADAGWFVRGGNSSTVGNENPENERMELVILSCLVDHPDVGLILFETGCAENVETNWGAPLTDIFPRTTYTPDQTLPGAIRKAGYDIKDVKAVIMGHLHLDHAGGLEHFVGTDVPVYVHEDEFKHACWAVATRSDIGVYLPHYMKLEGLNWQTFADETLDIFQGITLHLSPGHSPGLVAMQVNLARDGTFLWTSDQFHIADNYRASKPQGWLARDHTAWIRSLHKMQRLERMYRATLIFGHDKGVADELIAAKKYYE